MAETIIRTKYESIIAIYRCDHCGRREHYIGRDYYPPIPRLWFLIELKYSSGSKLPNIRWCDECKGKQNVYEYFSHHGIVVVTVFMRQEDKQRKVNDGTSR